MDNLSKESLKTSPCERNEEDEEDEDEDEENEDEEDEDDKVKSNGESSSNSTVEENNNEKKTGSVSSVRPYVRSKMQRLRWTPDLHQRFVLAVERLGGQDRATPKLVLQLMSIKGLSIAHVKSHLQMYRSKKTDDLSQGGHGNIYNFNQLPMMHGFNPRPLPNFRSYEDVSWRDQEKWMNTPSISRGGLYGSMTDKIFRGNYVNSTTNNNSHIASSSNEHYSTWRTHESKNQFKPPLELIPITLSSQATTKGQNSHFTEQRQERPTMKRKASESELDLNLSLNIKNNVLGSEEVESDLSLSLYSPLSSSSSRKKHCRMKERGDDSEENGGRTSTLDLTL